MQSLIGYGVVVGDLHHRQRLRVRRADAGVPGRDAPGRRQPGPPADRLPPRGGHCHRGTGETARTSFPEGHRVAFTGDQYLYGTTLRELLTLRTLHELRVNAFGM